MPANLPRFCTVNQRTGKYEDMTGPFKTIEEAEEWLGKWGEWWKSRGFRLVLCIRTGAKNVPVPRETDVNSVCEKK